MVVNSNRYPLAIGRILFVFPYRSDSPESLAIKFVRLEFLGAIGTIQNALARMSAQGQYTFSA